MRTPAAFCLFIMMIFSLILGCNNKSEIADFDKFTGRWSLYIVENKTSDTEPWQPMGGRYEGRQGFILYDGRGGMGVHHVTDNYGDYALKGKGGIDSLSTDDLKHLANNFVYFGKYKVDPEQKLIEHHIESASNPGSWGTMVKRKYGFSGDSLILEPVKSSFPKQRLKWIRVNDR